MQGSAVATWQTGDEAQGTRKDSWLPPRQCHILPVSFLEEEKHSVALGGNRGSFPFPETKINDSEACRLKKAPVSVPASATDAVSCGTALCLRPLRLCGGHELRGRSSGPCPNASGASPGCGGSGPVSASDPTTSHGKSLLTCARTKQIVFSETLLRDSRLQTIFLFVSDSEAFRRPRLP